ncbi:LacI family DNA-binding transcriptional regulator [Streptomyces aureus]
MGNALPPRRLTLDQVAERAGVSRSVASRVLNNAPHVSRAKRDAVERAVRDLGFVANSKARALATSQSGVAALVISRQDPSILADPFYAQVIVGISAALEEGDLHLMLCLAESERGRARVEKLLRSGAVDGVMMMALHADDPLIKVADKASTPVVFGGRPGGTPPQWYVDIDNVAGARAATEHLLSRGRRNVVTITGPLDTEVGQARHRGYREALLLAGLKARASETGDFTEASGAAAMSRLLEHQPDLDGVFAANDNMAAGALRVLRGAGRSVPEEVSVVGFDDLAVAQNAQPALTTVHQPIRDLGTEMARMLVALIGGKNPSPILLPSHLVVRSST